MPNRIALPRLFTGTPSRLTVRDIFVRWRDRRTGRARIRALLMRHDDHLVDDMGATRFELRRRFGVWDSV
ncbi:hypothetical protein DEA8626_00382 [Defluviimonas aquaemixtae]|uniref:DUF1127 domain-containing protein n=1 Tax=Albidovulum aquaemixtae TaxID=1542388 RepID=A0A2R8B2Q3_9RHOB|nr:hypothetical protein [Defluviimonas aquaemixtae]SPH16868.1 hypothetical protein DEA8626_00382 [Defluviimonas aquaemixtae]